MSSNASVQFHMRFVTEKHQELIISLEDLIESLVGEKVEVKKKKANISLQIAKDLKSSIAQQDCPSWLSSLIKVLEYFVNGQYQQSHVIKYLIKNVEEIRANKWVFNESSQLAFDFDSIYEHYKAQSRLPELFEQIINILEEILDSGEVDSVAMMAALTKVISTLKKNKNGSYFSINSAWSFLIAFLKNYMWAELAKVPVLGTAMEALEKTISETNAEMFKVHSEVQSEVRDVVEREVKALQKKTDFKFISYDIDAGEVTSLVANPVADERE